MELEFLLLLEELGEEGIQETALKVGFGYIDAYRCVGHSKRDAKNHLNKDC
jgi:hypothetical protein